MTSDLWGCGWVAEGGLARGHGGEAKSDAPESRCTRRVVGWKGNERRKKKDMNGEMMMME
jgi:hypothetical protein